MSRLAAAAARAGPLRLGAANGPGPGILAYIIESISVTRSPTLSHCQARAGAESDSETRRPGATNGLGSYSKMLPMTRDPGPSLRFSSVHLRFSSVSQIFVEILENGLR